MTAPLHPKMTREEALLLRAAKYLRAASECPDCGGWTDCGPVRRESHEDGCGLLALLDDIKAWKAERRADATARDRAAGGE